MNFESTLPDTVPRPIFSASNTEAFFDQPD